MSINEITISATLSDNDFPYATMTPPTSDGGAQGRATEEMTTPTTTSRQGTEQHETQAGQHHRSVSLLARLPKLKREKSFSETLERKKKKVKFSTSDDNDDVIVDTRVYDPHVDPIGDCGEDEDDRALPSPFKKFLRKKSKKRKSTIETQTENVNDPAWKEKGKNNSKVRKNGDCKESSMCVGEGADTEQTLPPCPTERGTSGGDTERAAEEHASCGCLSTTTTSEHCPAKSSPESVSLTRPEPGEEKSAKCDVSTDAVASTVPYPAATEGSESVSAFSERDERMCAPEGCRDPQVPDQSCEYIDKKLHQDNQVLVTPRQPAEGSVRPGCDAPNECRPNSGTQELNASSEADSPPQQNGCLLDDAELSPRTPEIKDSSVTSCSATVKREGTFTLDGPPPAKITKSADDAAGENAAPAGDQVVDPLQFFIPLVTSESSSDNTTSGKPVKKKVPAPLSKSKENRSMKSQETKMKNRTPQALETKTNNRSVKPQDKKTKLSDQSSTATVLKNSAKQTLANVWRNTVKPQETPKKPSKPTPKPACKVSLVSEATAKRQQDDKLTGTILLRRRETSKPVAAKEKPVSSMQGKEQRESQRPSRSPTKTTPRQDFLRKSTEKSSMWGAVSLASFKRDGTFTKKYDTEKDRLQAECSKLSVEKDRLQSELHEARTRLEEEMAARKALRRTHELSLRQLREGELRRTEVLLADMKNRLEDEKRESLLQQKDVLSRCHENELMRAEREREESHRKVLMEARTAQERLKAEMRREAHRPEPSLSPCCRCSDRDLERMNRDLSALREHKKRLEEALQTLQESERQRAGELRRLHDEHEVAVAKIHRANKSEGARLLDELRSKERSITILERQVAAQASKLRHLEEKLQQRDGSSDRVDDSARKQTTRGGGGSGASGKRQKEGAAGAKDGGKARDKEQCAGNNNINNNNHSNSNSSTPSHLAHPNQPIALFLEAVGEASITAMSLDLHPPSPAASDMPAPTTPEKPCPDNHDVPAGPPQVPPEILAEMEQLRQDLERQKTQNEEHLQQLAQQKEEFEEERKQLREENEKLKEEYDVEKNTLEEEVGAKVQKVEEQQRVMDAQKQVMEEQKQVMEELKMMMEEQQVRIVELETECLVPPPLPTTWHRRESCVKVSELPTVMEQNSDDECSSSSSSTPTETTPPDLPFALEDDTLEPSCLSMPADTPLEQLAWPEIPADEMAAQYALLSREHQGLQKSYQLLASTTAAASSSPDYHPRDGTAALWLSAKVLELEAEATKLREELQDTRDHADLLEFRCLELTEGADKSSEFGSATDTRDQSTNTEPDEVTTPTTNEDLSLPLSIDSGLDLSSDYKKARVSEARAWLAQLSRAAGEEEAPAALQLAALLDWVATLPLQPHHALSSPVSPTLPTPPSPSKAGMGVEELGCDVGRDLMVLATRLQESLADPAAQEAVLLDTITKLRVLDSSLCQLQDRVVTLTDENRELQEAVASLSEAQETRTEASGTESELVHRKTPSIHSDLSDAELSDSPEHVQQARPGKMPLEAATSFQESGIFDTSCELVHVTTQTDLESDEYLMQSTLDQEQVTLSKTEYDTIVESERRLRQEMEHLKCDKQQLALECDTLKTQIRTQSSSRGTDAEEALKGEIRVLKQRLSMSERARQEVFEEKCELEEEENDSRLMVQRLESQMEAAREMENLLSASLSQEQEISRELQRRVRDLQILDKENRGRFDKLEAIKNKMEEKATTLSDAKDALAAQLTFVMYGLLVVEQWRRWAARPLTLVPFSSKQTEMSWEENKNSLNVNEYVSVCPPVVLESCVQKVDVGLLSQDAHSRVAQKHLPEEHGQRRPAEANEEEPQNKRQRGIKTRSQGTMTAKSESVSEREKYYLEQIENLQKEKMSLRKGHESERRNSLQQHNDLEGEVQEVRQQLAEVEHEKCKLLIRLEEAQEKDEEMKNNYLNRIEELKSDMSRYKDLYEMEKKALIGDHKTKLLEVEKERGRLEERVHQLELQISTFRQELEIVGTSVAQDIVEMDTDIGTVISHNKKSSMEKPHCAGEIVEKIRQLVKSETGLRQRIYDLEKKECAYRETIGEADKIMSSHVTSYKQQIEELQAKASQQTAKIQQMEASEERLRTTLRTNNRTSDGARISDLLDRLIETENSELKLKERVWNLEKSEKELQIKLMEGEKKNQVLRGELRDQEELVHRMMTLETENNALSAELSQAHDSTRKMSEVQQNESYLRGRVEELEVTENMLRETLQQADQILAQRERKLRDQVSSLQEEIQSYKVQLEAAASKEHGARESELSYRKQLEELRTRLAEAERDLMESSSETISHETQHRSEVTKLRNQLKLCNSQLLELDRLNCELRDRVMAAELEGQRLAKELEEHGRRHEQDLLNFNLQVSSRDSRLEDLEHQLEQMSHDHAASELDALDAMPIAALHTSITALTTAVKSCKSCSAAQSETLVDVTKQLGTLTELLEGESNNPDVMDETSDIEEEDISDTAENLAHEATTTPPPDPAREGSREDFSGDSVSMKLRRSARWRNRRRLEDPNGQRRMGPQGSSTILEELEEKVRELEEALGRKEEELRLADVEACEINSQLEARDTALAQKIQEIEHLNITLASLRLQLVATLEDAEKARSSLEGKHKIKLEELTNKVEEITKKAECLAGHCHLKDSIIFTLASQIRAILRSGNMGVIINQLQRLNEVSESKESDGKMKEMQMPPVSDFDVETICSFLTQPNEMASLPQSTISDGMEPSSLVTLQTDTSLAPSHSKLEHTSHVIPQGSPSLVQQKKSRIPRFMPPSVSRGKCAPKAPTPKPQSVSISMQVSNLPKKIIKTSQTETLVKTRSVLEHTVKTVSHPLYGVKSAPVIKQEVKLTPPDATSVMKPLATSTPARPTGRKIPSRQERSRFLSDARRIKRMVTGVVPLDAAVDCASAPEWRERSPLGNSSEVEATCVPRPHNLHITRRVGVDGVVIAWDPLEHDCVAGFQVLVGGRVVQHVRSPHRTKALVTGLPLAGSFTIGLVAVADDGRCSTPVIVTQDRSRLYPCRNVTAGHTVRRSITTSL
ncbi:microtubule-associated protein futsch-like isoform X5 [Portunus trituberculatus]|uniref:microtubule-associated protein futsch-like isoform X5 n=1 Tax=Portunus trituberculatus TaxID=210409 RepID=UPI001E1CCBD4|nr:microtubule-associated protein futsch-like isoform X5 [Portunus trituberculatus]